MSQKIVIFSVQTFSGINNDQEYFRLMFVL